jgi:hypothetical protein
MLANGLSAPQHSTYFVILVEGLVLVGIPGVAVLFDMKIYELMRKCQTEKEEEKANENG